MDIVVFGSGSQAKVVIDIIEKRNEDRVIGVVSSNLQSGQTFLGYQVLGADIQFLKDKNSCRAGIIAVGDNWIRARIEARILESKPEFTFVTAIHPFSSIGRNVSIGVGTVVCAGAVIGPFTQIGNHCILNTKCSVDHDNNFADFSSILPGAVTGGNVFIGSHTVLGIGSVVKNGVSLGAHTVIGAGAVVLKDIGDHVVSYGVPAKIFRARRAGEPYL